MLGFLFDGLFLCRLSGLLDRLLLVLLEGDLLLTLPGGLVLAVLYGNLLLFEKLLCFLGLGFINRALRLFHRGVRGQLLSFFIIIRSVKHQVSVEHRHFVANVLDVGCRGVRILDEIQQIALIQIQREIEALGVTRVNQAVRDFKVVPVEDEIIRRALLITGVRMDVLRNGAHQLTG